MEMGRPAEKFLVPRILKKCLETGATVETRSKQHANDIEAEKNRNSHIWYSKNIKSEWGAMEIECVQSGNYKKEAEKNVKSPSREILVRFWNKSNGNWMVLESGQSRGAAKLALATSWIDLRKVCQCKSSFWHTAGGIELSHGGLQCRFTMLAAAEEKLPALEGFGSPTYFLK